MRLFRFLGKLVFTVIFAPLIIFTIGVERIVRFPWGSR